MKDYVEQHMPTIDVDVNNFVVSPFDKQGNLRFQIPNVFSTILLVLP